MRIPSTSELVESQANKAYDKLAVISENLDKLEDIYEFIFNYYAFLKEKLSHYVPNDKDSIIKGVKEFHDGVKFLTDIEFSNILVPEFKSTISCRYVDNDGKVPALVLACGDNEIAKIYLGWNTETNKPLLIVPDTVETMDNSAVTVAYLHTYVKSITDKLNTSIGNINTLITSATTSIENLESRVSTLENQIVQKAEKSDLDGLKAQVGGIQPGLDVHSIKGIFWSPNQTYTTGKDQIWVEAEIGKTYPGNELYTECVHDESTHTTTLSGQLNTGTYMCLSPSKITLSYTASGTAYNGSTLTSDYYSHREERGVFAPVNI